MDQKEITYGDYKRYKDTQEWKIWVDPAVLVLAASFSAAAGCRSIPSALPAGNQPPQTNYTTAHPGTLGASYSLAPAKYNEALTARSTRDDDEPAQINFVQGKMLLSSWGRQQTLRHAPRLAGLRAPIWLSDCGTRNRQCLFRQSHNETTAVFTFFNEATTAESITDGPLRIVDRNGTTTIYLNTAPANFANQDSFRSGIPILTSTLHQQAVNTPDGTFTDRVRKHHLVDERLHH